MANARGPLHSHLQFVVRGSGGARTATLAVLSLSSGKTQTQVFEEASTWTESGLTHDNAPAPGSSLGRLSTLVAGCYSTLDVPIAGDGTCSFLLTTGATVARDMTSRETSTPPQLRVAVAAPPSGPVVVAAGDIACAPDDASFNGGLGTATACRAKHTGAIVQGVDPVALLPLGDEQYDTGSAADFAASYDLLWGVPGLPGGRTLTSISHPVVGNHEYGSPAAGGYAGYFGSAAGPGNKLYYSYDIGNWHLVAINTECTRLPGATGCAVGSAQEAWLRADLAAHQGACTLAYGHRPRWSSDSFASADIAPLIRAMVEAGVELYLAGHAHSYERFVPQHADGVASSTGITQVTVGTGGSC